MAILKVAQIGHPVLRAIAHPVPVEDIDSAPVQMLIDDMIATMREYGGVGIAAPQVHVSARIVLIEVHQNDRYPNAPEIPLTPVINPVITPLTEDTDEDWEGCLSVEGFRGRVPRYTHVGVTGYERTGKKLEWDATDFFARVVQHECDHLDGHLYVDRIQDMSSFTTLANFQRYHLPPAPAPAGGEQD